MITFQKTPKNPQSTTKGQKNPTKEFLLKIPFKDKDWAKNFAREKGIFLRWIPAKTMWGYTDSELPKELQPFNQTPKPKKKIVPTQEQQAPIESPDIGEIKKIHAFAGTGKTTTLEAYAETRPGKKVLYLAFNKSVADEAKLRFPENTTTLTPHALARRNFPQELQNRIIGNNPRPNKVQEFFSEEINNLEAVLILQTLECFLNSNDPIIDESHCPEQEELEEVKIKNEVSHNQNLPDGWQEHAVSFAKKLWEDMINTKGTWPITHNGYLKWYALTKPKLPYDIILLDEAQDTNPVVEGIVTRQCVHANIILVGDTHQQIYTWRGAIDSMARIRTTQNFNLTASFRFGPEIAACANTILHTFKKEGQKLIGHRPTDKVYQYKRSPFTRIIYERRPIKHAKICRSGVGLFNEAINTIERIKLWQKKNPEQPPLKIAFVGTTAAEAFSPKRHYDMTFILDIFHLLNQNPHRIRDQYIKSFSKIEELREIAENPSLKAGDLKKAIKLCDTYPRELEILIREIDKYSASPDDPHTWVTFTTAHRSKGLEWENVSLGDDFQNLFEEGRPRSIQDINIEEINLIYVAMTRAQKQLELNEDLNTLLQK